MMNPPSTNQSTSVYQKVTSIAADYFGPAADRFISRQITSHLNKPADQLKPEDLPTLLKWTKVTLGHLTEDRDLVDDYVRKMDELISSLE